MDGSMTVAHERPELELLRYVNPARFGPHHLDLVKRLVDADTFAGLDVKTLAYRVHIGDLWVFETGEQDRYATHDMAIVLLSTEGLPPHTLLVEGLAGDGVLARKAAIIADVAAIAGFYGCGRVRALTAREGFDQFAEGAGFRPVATLWEMEVPDGRIAEEHDIHAEG